ncbi:helix-turn-helix transcriptional regulator [Methylobacterium sp. Leaf117]|uniref:helix-turn-helix domain-containing protein n=1 Tax=Methylobacterium sp. Leaf117 TaxID=1736260 RepID=UPI00138F2F15|nr:helix-turn-helix transcriptional regulator [Methylobacterium sp. Leaf117]
MASTSIARQYGCGIAFLVFHALTVPAGIESEVASDAYPKESIISRADSISSSLPYVEAAVNENLCDMQRYLADKAHMDKNDRIREARARAGFSSAAEAARRLNMSYGTYSSHENGLRGVKEQDLVRYARAFGVTVEWLRTGADVKYEGRSAVHCIGEAGTLNNGQVQMYGDEDPDKVLLVSAMINAPCSYLYVRGKELRGIADQSSAIICSSKFSFERIHTGDLCLCMLEDGRILIKKVYDNGDGKTYDLEAPLSDTMRSVSVSGFAPVYMIITPNAYQLIVESNHRLAASFDDATKQAAR